MKCDFCDNEAVGVIARCIGPSYCSECVEIAEKAYNDYQNEMDEYMAEYRRLNGLE